MAYAVQGEAHMCTSCASGAVANELAVTQLADVKPKAHAHHKLKACWCPRAAVVVCGSQPTRCAGAAHGHESSTRLRLQGLEEAQKSQLLKHPGIGALMLASRSKEHVSWRSNERKVILSNHTSQ